MSDGLLPAVRRRLGALIGGVCLSFYDWYADLPPASPQGSGDRTDEPDGGDWWNSSYAILWGSNIPQTRTPDAHFMTEARYRGQKVVVVSPGLRRAHEVRRSLAPRRSPGSDGALAMAMGHVIFKEFYVDRRVPSSSGSPARKTPTCPSWSRYGAQQHHRSPTASCVPPTSETRARTPGNWKTDLPDAATGEPVAPERLDPVSRWGDEGMGKWNSPARRDRAGP